MAQFLIVRDHLLRELGAVDYKRHLLVTTDASEGALRQIVHDEGFRVARRPGRRERPLLGADRRSGSSRPRPRASTSRSCSRARPHMDERSRRPPSRRWPIPPLALGGVLWLPRPAAPEVDRRAHDLQRAAGRAGRLVLPALGREPRQGDRPRRAPRRVGTDAVRAVGTADQHSQLQLWLEGPRDKVVLFLRVEDHGDDADIPAAYQDLEERRLPRRPRARRAPERRAARDRAGARASAGGRA